MTDAIDKRLNYYNRQFLKAPDFIDEQVYHVDRLRRHNRLFHTDGIAEGLDVERDANQAGLVSVAPGTAVDADGRFIVLAEARPVSVMEFRGKQAQIIIAYDEQPYDNADYQQQVSGETMSSRTHESPDVLALAANQALLPGQLLLAVVRVDRDGNVTDINTSGRKTVSARGVDTGPKFIDTIPGNFTVRGDLTVDGNVRYGGDLLGDDGAFTNIWFAGEVDGAREIATNNAWTPIDGMMIEMSLLRDAFVKVNYLLNLQPGEVNAPEYVVYTVVDGDTISGIAANFGLSVVKGTEDIMALNGLTSSLIRPGDKLKIPGGWAGELNDDGTPKTLYLIQKGNADSALRGQRNAQGGVVDSVKRDEVVLLVNISEQGDVGKEGKWIRVRKLDENGREGFVEANPFQFHRPEGEGDGKTFTPSMMPSVSEDLIAVRVVVDDTAINSAATFYRPTTAMLHSAQLRGEAVLPLQAGAHRVRLEWYKFGDALQSWRIGAALDGFPDDLKDIAAGRALIAIAFYQ